MSLLEDLVKGAVKSYQGAFNSVAGVVSSAADQIKQAIVYKAPTPTSVAPQTKVPAVQQSLPTLLSSAYNQIKTSGISNIKDDSALGVVKNTLNPINLIKEVPGVVSNIGKAIYENQANPNPEQKAYEDYYGINYVDKSHPVIRTLTAPGIFAAKQISRFLNPGLQPVAKDLAEIYEVQRPGGFADQVATGKIPVSFLDELAVLQKTAPQIVGDVAQGVLSAYAGGAAESAFTRGESVGLRQALKTGYGEGIKVGTAFGTAQAASSGSTDPLEIVATVGTSGAAGGLIGGLISGAIPASKEVVNAVKNVADKHNELLAKYGGEGGFIKNPLAPKGETPSFDIRQKQAEAYVKEQIAKRETAREVDGQPNFISRLYSDVKNKLVDFTYPIEDAVRKAQKVAGLKFSDIQVSPLERVHDQIDMALRAPTLAGKFMEDNGLKEVIRKVDNLDNLDQYLVAKQSIDVDTRGIETGRDLQKDIALVKAFAPKYEALAQIVGDYSKNLLDYAVRSGLVSPELAQRLKDTYPNYVPMNRVFNELEKPNSVLGNKGVANLSNQSIIKTLKGSVREVESPFASLLQKTKDAFAQGEKNKAAQILTEFAKTPAGEAMGIRPLQEAPQVKDRIEAMSTLKAFKPVAERLKNVLSNKKAEIRSLMFEINRLNKEGLSVALKKEYKSSPEKLKSAIKTQIKPGELIDKRPKTWDDFTNSYLTKDKLKKEFGNVDLLTLDLKLGGYSRLIDLGFDESVAKSIAGQIFKEPIVKPEVTTRSDVYAEMNNKDPKQFIESLILDKNSELENIKSKISRRDEKLNRFVDELQDIKTGFEDIKAIRKDLWDQVQMNSKLIKDPEMDTITVFRDGIKETWEAPRAIAAAAKNLNSQQLNILGKLFAIPTRLAKLGITGINIPFIGANIVKDQIDAFINSSNSFKTSVANPSVFMKALTTAVGHGPLYDELVRNGAGGTSFDIAREAPVESVAKIRAGKNIGSRILYTVKHPSELLRAVENIVGRSEEFTRIQQYEGTKRAMKVKGASPEDIAIKARMAARENTVNFARRGEWGQVLNSAFLYLNAGIQGSRLILKNAATKPVSTAAKIAAALFVPMATFTAWNLSDPKREEAYRDIQEYEKEGNFIIIPPNPTKDDQGRWNVIKIPMPAGYKYLAMPVRKYIESTKDISSVGLANIGKSLFGTLSPVGATPGEIFSSALPQAIKPSVEAYANKNFFTGLPIVPNSMENLSPSMQTKPYTSGSAREIAKVGNWSPIKVEAFINGTFGGVGSQALNASDRALAGAGVIPEDQIGGQDLVEAVMARFSKARGGATDNTTTEKIKDVLTKQADDKFRLKQEAEVLFEELNKLPKAEANKKAQEIRKVNPLLFTELKNVVQAKDKGLDYNDRLVMQLQVANGERAKFIYENLKAFKTKEEKAAYAAELQKKKILTSAVIKQINQLGSLK